MEKIVGTEREEHTKEIATIVSDITTSSESAVIDEAGDNDIEATKSNPVVDVEEVMSIMSATSLSPKEESTVEMFEEEHANSSVVESTTGEVMQTDPGTASTKIAETGPMKSPVIAAVSRSTRSTNSKKKSRPVFMDVQVKKELAENEVERSNYQKRFCPEEDDALKEGIKKHGLGKWSVMLKDKTLKFHCSRTRDAIRMRADTLGLSKKKKKQGQKQTVP